MTSIVSAVQPGPWTTNASPPAWHPDPAGRFEFRYWNGERWTADVSSDGNRFVDPTWGSGPPAAAGHTGPKRTSAVAAFVVGLSSLAVAWVPFLFVLGAGGAVTAVVLGVIALRHIRAGTGTGRGFAAWGILSAVGAAGLCVAGYSFTVAVMREVDRMLDPGKFEVTVDSCTVQDGLLTFDGTILNKDDRYHDYTIDVRYTANGKLIGSDTIEVNRVAPLERGAIHGTQFLDSGTAGVACVVDDVNGVRPPTTG